MHNILQRVDHHKVDMRVFVSFVREKKKKKIDGNIFSRAELIRKLVFENGEE